MAGPLEQRLAAELEKRRSRGERPEQGVVDRILSSKPVEYAENLARMGVQGITFGVGDEIAAAEDATLDYILGRGSGTWKERFDAHMGKSKEAMEGFREEHPKAALAAEMIGALPTALATGPLSIARAAIPATARGASRIMTRQPMKRPAVLGRMGKGLAGGAASGGVYGFGVGEGGVEGRLESAALPAAFGGMLGGVTPAVAGPIARHVGEAVSRARTARKGNMEAAAVDPIQEVLKQDVTVGGGTFPSGPGAKLADVGPAARADLDEAIQEVGGNADVASRHIRERAEAAGPRLTQALDEQLGSPAGLRTAEKALKDDPELGPLYERGYATPIDYSTGAGETLERLMRNRIPGSVIGAANDIMRRQGQGSRQIKVQLGENDEIVGWERLPDTRQLHYILQGLDSEIGQLGQKEGVKGTLRGATKKLRREVRDALGEANPIWAQAQSRAADEFSALNSLRLGYDAMKPGMIRSELREELTGLSDAEKRWVAQGMREYIDDVTANAKQSFVPDPTVGGHVSRRAREDPETLRALQDLSSKAVRNKVAMVIGEDQADKLFGEIDEVAGAYMLQMTASTNLRQQAKERLGRGEALYQQSPQGKLAAGDVPGAVTEVGRRIIGRDPEVAANPDTAAAVIEVLLRDATPPNVEAMRKVLAAPNPRMAGMETARLAELLAGRGGLAAIPAMQGGY